MEAFTCHENFSLRCHYQQCPREIFCIGRKVGRGWWVGSSKGWKTAWSCLGSAVERPWLTLCKPFLLLCKNWLRAHPLTYRVSTFSQWRFFFPQSLLLKLVNEWVYLLQSQICAGWLLVLVSSIVHWELGSCEYGILKRSIPAKNSVQLLKGWVIGASLSQPHIDEFAVEFLSLYIYICIYISYVVP